MPEGDTAYLACRRMDAALAGHRLTRSDLRVPRHATADLSGRRVEGVVARGKHLLHRIEGGLTLHTHLDMEGAWHLYRPGDRWRRPAFQARVVLATETYEAVGFSLGTVDLVATEREHEIVGHLGPDLLGDDWDPDEAARRLAADPNTAIGEALLDQRLMAGLGNVYRSEVCYLAGISPETPVGGCDLDHVVALSKRLIEANRATGNQITTGDARPGRGRWVYGRDRRPCRRCGTPVVKRSSASGRPLYLCPSCQPGSA